MSVRALRKRRRLVEIGGGDLRAVGESQILSQRARRHHGHVPAADGLTPLHLATSIEDAKDFVDALTDDPQQIGLSCLWSGL
ncbi:hypothetical protein GUJ93_ZPchr0010g8594 [Zizania palustris]|uniref:Uncharacterized protein n=1 Tax=Zizania palustris TaxID=103762 RepID=A0A8J5WCC8_ZIZPA|nr:hypothetical protein GUJ93_ZPchr0010g8594 [Zizania palustris]